MPICLPSSPSAQSLYGSPFTVLTAVVRCCVVWYCAPNFVRYKWHAKANIAMQPQCTRGPIKASEE